MLYTLRKLGCVSNSKRSNDFDAAWNFSFWQRCGLQLHMPFRVLVSCFNSFLDRLFVLLLFLGPEATTPKPAQGFLFLFIYLFCGFRAGPALKLRLRSQHGLLALFIYLFILRIQSGPSPEATTPKPAQNGASPWSYDFKVSAALLYFFVWYFIFNFFKWK